MRLLIVSDIHSNLEAFEAVLIHAGAVDRIWCLGDLVGYGPDPNACVELLRSKPHLCVAGNHDWAALGKLDLADFNADARDASVWTRKRLTADNLAYLRALPEQLPKPDSQPFWLVHGSPCQPIWEYILDERSATDAFGCFGAESCFHGHTHLPILIRLVDHEGVERLVWSQPSGEAHKLGPERMLVNPGSVGQPRDGNPKASYMILDTEALTVEHRRVAYEVWRTQDKMLDYKLPTRLAMRLAQGL
jgi:diadenosine tetraphosphatase ApaH/serine/threonine PP2A family protein phosphatase